MTAIALLLDMVAKILTLPKKQLIIYCVLGILIAVVTLYFREQSVK